LTKLRATKVGAAFGSHPVIITVLSALTVVWIVTAAAIAAQGGRKVATATAPVTGSRTTTTGATVPANTTTKPPASCPAAPAPPSGYAMTFDDEFNGSLLDAQWVPYWLDPRGGNVQNGTVMENANVAVSGGDLRLILTGSSGAIVSTNPSGGVANGFAFTYGYVAACIWLPGGGSVPNWPAFWTDGQNWPTDGEMDIMEGLEQGNVCFHFHSSSGGPGSCVSGDYTGWHLYTATWAPGSVTYSYDGVVVGTIMEGVTASPMYLVLENSATNNGSGGPVLTPSTMLVDYVRVYQP
jgi:beta-glucanase (GH16 family)